MASSKRLWVRGLVPPSFLEYLSLHRDCTATDVALASKLSSHELESATHPQIVRLRTMVYAVRHELHKAKSFVRLFPCTDLLWYGFLNPTHRIGMHVASWLARRFPMTVILLGNTKESWISLFHHNGLHTFHGPSLFSILSKRNISDAFPSSPLWETYYTSQYRKERRNLRAFRRYAPATYLRMTREEVMHRAGSGARSLIDFFGEEDADEKETINQKNNNL